MARLVMVMPTWAPESWVDSDAQRGQHPLGPGVTLSRELLDLGPVDGHERELRRHEHAAGGDQQQRDRQQDPRGHRSSRPSRCQSSRRMTGPMKRAVHVRRARPSGCGEGDRIVSGHSRARCRDVPNPRCGRSAAPYDEAPPSPGAPPMTTPPPSRRVLVGGALAATAAAVTDARRPGVRRRRQARRPAAAQRPRPAPRHPLLLRPHADARARRTEGGRCEGVVRAAAPAAQRARQGGRRGRCLVARAVLLARQAVAAADHRGPGWLGGDGQLPAPGACSDGSGPTGRCWR